MPSLYTLENKIRQIFTQSHNGCVANGTSGLMCSLDKDKNKIDTPSRYFIYYNARCMDENGFQYNDEETTIRSCMKSITKFNFVNYKHIFITQQMYIIHHHLRYMNWQKIINTILIIIEMY